jgi:hypothetical protein
MILNIIHCNMVQTGIENEYGVNAMMTLVQLEDKIIKARLLCSFCKKLVPKLMEPCKVSISSTANSKPYSYENTPVTQL